MSFQLSLSSLGARTGRGVTVAVVDSGIHAAHPHVRGITGGASFDDAGCAGDDVTDRLGHGTAVAAAIREKAPDAAILALKVFDTTLSTTGLALVAAIDWAAGRRVDIVNLSLGTDNSEHAAALQAVVNDAAVQGVLIVSAAPQDGVVWYPGALPGVIGVDVDWTIERDVCAVEPGENGLRLRASGFPRPLPGVPPQRNFRGPSFAVANATGLIACAIEGARCETIADLVERLRTFCSRPAR